jgi:outer membrane beta-barrel protein
MAQKGGKMHKLKILTLILFSLSFVSSTFAQSSKYQRPTKNVVTNPEEKKEEQKDSEKVDISDIEQKYWAPKDTDFSVVQSRAYTKTNRFSISVQGGLLINDTFNEGSLSSVSTNYFLSERHGFGITYVTGNLGNTKVIDNFRDQVGGTGGVEPDRGRINSYYGINYVWVPIYAKMSLLEKKILYFDMAISPSIGITNYEKLYEQGNIKESGFTYGIDISQYFYLNKNWAIRADLKNTWFSEKRVDFRRGTDISTETNNTTMFLMGFIYYH